VTQLDLARATGILVARTGFSGFADSGAKEGLSVNQTTDSASRGHVTGNTGFAVRATKVDGQSTVAPEFLQPTGNHTALFAPS